MNTIESIANKQNYINPSRYISGRIVEYDIKSANISTLRDGNYITQEKYEYLNNLPKQQREIEIGLMIKEDHSIYTNIQNGIKSAKYNLLTFNNIDPSNIIRIANDAVYINTTTDLKYNRFGNYILFRPKSISNVYLNLYNNIILFLEFKIDGTINVDIKGIGDNMYLHQDYIVNAIISTVVLYERSGIIDAVSYLSELLEHYIKRELPIGYYREFNSESKFRIRNMFGNYHPFGNDNLGTNNLSEADIQYVDINHNLFVLRELWSIFLEIYEMRMK